MILLAACAPETRTDAAAGRAAPGERLIRVVCDNNYPPYAFTGADGKLEGIVVDQWRAWERETGIAVELRGLPWSEALAAFDAGEAEVIDTIFNTEERRRRYAFTEPYANIEVPVFAHKSLSGIVGPEDLRGLKVAVKDGDAAILELIHAGVAELSLLPSYAAIIEAASRLDFRVFCVDAPPALYFLYKRGIDRD
ncbi:MAG: transporter substrate-binding domain-containing protein, partial [Spirochaetaceae bacterium]|nr:transporter substrate-binding domain-containing protein [Spirochaetaceae bacterium]